ncbi:YceI family protein [Nocardia bhagyanarayanae]|uniref:Polyisoprenoid-binding protein YceI n=1 Tax=Nocardia bhagyanarayanae TaxID=1215925 RepID=A0A543EY84_9NOCA|nr:YceI family protein [Nocardia bhagyanarayanae]TQM26548.1 polyisoprenoid-binding protein YceI [Nocardia bhagyanarayanae]
MTTAIAKGLSAGTWVIDPAHSTVGFSVRHLMVSKVRGRFTDFEGKLVIGEDGAASAEAEIRVNSLTTDNEQRDAHLRTADFFHAEEFPLMTFKSTGFRVNGEEFVVDGEFTIRGNTKPVSLNVEFLGVNQGMGNGPVAGFEAKTVVSRREFGLDIDMPLPDGGAVIGDKVTLTLEIEAGLQS